VTEGEWLSCTNPTRLLDLLGRASERKLRLFAVDCCRRVADFLTDDRSRAALAAVEAGVDGPAGGPERRRVREAAAGAYRAVRAGMVSGGAPGGMRSLYAAEAVALTADRDRAAVLVAVAVASLAREAPDENDRRQEQARQVFLLRDIFGNPFRPVRPDPAWMPAGAVTLARTMYESRDFAAMPLLADLLEEAGCPEPVAAHCRQPGEHVRGCWVVDLLLGKE
jgi:hypothetical protein